MDEGFVVFVPGFRFEWIGYTGIVVSGVHSGNIREYLLLLFIDIGGNILSFLIPHQVERE